MIFEFEKCRYPDKTREEIEVSCPFCLGNCNCRLCLKEDTSVLVCALFLLHSVLLSVTYVIMYCLLHLV